MDTPIQFLYDLVAIDSVNPDLVPGGAGESAVAQYIAETLSRASMCAYKKSSPAAPMSSHGPVVRVGGARSSSTGTPTR
jgi:acetylornithine deacetylase